MLIDILKIAGIVLLCILWFILLFILLFLLIPVRYKGTISYNKLLYFEIHISWFITLITLSLRFDGDTEIQMSFFGIKRSLTEKINEYRDKHRAEKEFVEESDGHCPSSEMNRPDGKIDSASKTESDIDTNQKSRSLLDEVKAIIRILLDPLNRELYVKVIECLKDSIKHMLPKELNGYFSFGFEDPADTGKALMLLGFFYPLYGEHIQIDPYFEEREPEGKLDFSGHFNQISAGFPIVKILLDKDIREVYNQIKER